MVLGYWTIIAVAADGGIDSHGVPDGATGAANATLQRASQMALIPTWFLAAYLMVILVARACLVLWERVGWCGGPSWACLPSPGSWIR